MVTPDGFGTIYEVVIVRQNHRVFSQQIERRLPTTANRCSSQEPPQLLQIGLLRLNASPSDRQFRLRIHRRWNGNPIPFGCLFRIEILIRCQQNLV